MPEKTQQQVLRNVRELFDKGVAAFQRQNLDYAITLFNQVLQIEPGFYQCREALRAAQAAHSKKAGGLGGFFKRMVGSASNSPHLAKAQIQVRSNPIEAISSVEQILNTDPNNVLAHKILAEAALNADFPRTAVLSLEIALRNAPNDREVALNLAAALKLTGQVARAEAVFTELEKHFPNDPTIAQAFKNLSAHKTLQEGGYEKLAEGTGSYREILRDKAKSETLEQENREVKTADVASQLLKEYEARLLQEPNNIRLMRSIAELHTKRNDFDRAMDYYQRLSGMENINDPSIDKAVSDLRLRKLDQAIAQLNPDNPEHQSEAAKLRAERQAQELADAQRRVDKYPNDLFLRFELGEVFFQRQMFSEAIREFQKAQSNPNRRVPALGYLGKCFSQRGMADLAARTLRTAITEKVVFDDEKKDLIYELGSVLEKSGKLDEAIEQYKIIYESDIEFRDVASKIDHYYTSKNQA